jgi:hypothetical protein
MSILAQIICWVLVYILFCIYFTWLFNDLSIGFLARFWWFTTETRLRPFLLIQKQNLSSLFPHFDLLKLLVGSYRFYTLVYVRFIQDILIKVNLFIDLFFLYIYAYIIALLCVWVDDFGWLYQIIPHFCLRLLRKNTLVILVYECAVIFYMTFIIFQFLLLHNLHDLHYLVFA